MEDGYFLVSPADRHQRPLDRPRRNQISEFGRRAPVGTPVFGGFSLSDRLFLGSSAQFAVGRR